MTDKLSWPGGFRFWALVPFLLFLVVFAALPIGQLVWLSFGEVRIDYGAFDWAFAGLTNFRKLAYDPIARDSIVNTVVFIVTTVPLTIGLGSLLAVLVDRSVLFAGLARNVVLWPAILAPVVVSLLWLLILSPDIGALNKLLGSFGIEGQGWLGTETAAMAVIIAVDVWHWTPLVFLLVYAALRGVDRDLVDAGRVDGATEWRAYRHIVFPLLLPTIVTAAAIRLISGIKAFDEMYLLTKGGPGTATTLVSLHIRSIFFDHLDLGYGAAFSVSIVVIVGVGVGLFVLTRKLSRLGSLS